MFVEVITFGCRLNQNEGAEIKKQAEASGLEDAIILNSCAVTSEAERQLRQTIRKLRREHSHKKIIVTGCAAQIDPEKYLAMPEVDAVVGNINKLEKATYASMVEDCTKRTLVNDIMSVRETAHYIPDVIEERVRAFLQVQNGCNHRCTFCVIPYGRGNSRSVPVGEIVSNAQQLVARGFQEIVLTGVDITDYGLDLPGQPNLAEMLKRLLNNVPDLRRLRLSSVDVAELKGDFITLLASENRLMPHVHISLQAGDNMILKRMKRRHLREDVIKFCAEARKARPDIELGADIIAGFPTEDEEMFGNTVALIEQLQISYLHVFPYSSRAGTPAARMPQVAKPIRKARAAILRDLGAKIMLNSNKLKVNKTMQVLAEGEMLARAEDFSIVKITNRKMKPGDVLNCLIVDACDNFLVGTALD